MIRILIVDDEPDTLTVLETAFNEDFEVVTASNGLDALEKIERVQPDLAIMDVEMPCLNGFDAVCSIRKNASFSNLPVVYLTGRSDAEAQ